MLLLVVTSAVLVGVVVTLVVQSEFALCGADCALGLAGEVLVGEGAVRGVGDVAAEFAVQSLENKLKRQKMKN